MITHEMAESGPTTTIKKPFSRVIGNFAVALILLSFYLNADATESGSRAGKFKLPVTIEDPLPLPVIVENPTRKVTIENQWNNPVPVYPVIGKVPAQFVLGGIFSDGSFNMDQMGLNPGFFSIPAGYSSMFINYVRCDVNQAEGVQVIVYLRTRAGRNISHSLVSLITTDANSIQIPGPGFAKRYVVGANLNAWLGIETPGGPDFGDTLTLVAQRSTTEGTGGLTCTVAGFLLH